MQNNLQQLYGNIDIYLFDQLLKGTYHNCRKIIDVGCGGGRNLVYFLQNGYEVFGVDSDPEAVQAVIKLAAGLAPATPPQNFIVAPAEAMPFKEGEFDLAICSAVLHFAKDEAHFDQMLRSVWSIIRPGGYLFARLAADTGIENLIIPLGNRRYLLPDGTERFLVNEQLLTDYTRQLNGWLHEPVKTTNVQHLRCMTTWCLQKL